MSEGQYNIINIGSFEEQWKLWCVQICNQNHLSSPKDRRTSTKNPLVPILETWHAPAFLPGTWYLNFVPLSGPGTSLLAKQQEAGQRRVAQHVTISVTLCTLRKIGSSTPKKRLLMIALVVLWLYFLVLEHAVIHTYVSLQIGYVQINFASTGVNIERCKLYCCIRKCIVPGWSCTIVSIRHHCFRLTCEKQNLQLLVDIIRYPLMSIQSLHCLCRASQLWMKASWMRAAVQMYSFLCPSNPIHGIIELEANGRCSWNCEHVTPKMTLRAIARGGNKTQQHHMKQRFNQCRDTFRATETNEQTNSYP